MRRTYQLAARVAEIDDLAERVALDMGTAFDTPLLRPALVEALLNAVVYGALRVPSSRARDVGDLVDAIAAAEARGDASEVVVVLEAAGDGSQQVIVRDPGPGHDPAARPAEADADPTAPSGRGLAIIRAAAESLAWNAAGNELTMRFRPIAERAGGHDVQ
jgi:anti-sigma regulatory factor (Ser/Thr protein kinase)